MFRHFLIALQFLTRIPIPNSIEVSEGDIGHAAAYFPFVGVIVGSCASIVFIGLNTYLPVSTSVIGVLIITAVLTNGFHEDGLADSFDGFGGGWDKENILRIMRDSRIGTFGGLSLILLILAKYNILSLNAGPNLWRWLIFAHTTSRWTVLPMCKWLPYAREQGQGGLVARRIDWRAIIIATVTLIAASFLLPLHQSLIAIVVTTGIIITTGLYYKYRIGGITGDCLGATNQLTEVAIYLVALLVSSHQAVL
jgi:adenosylcobinamide-GDP ribazoletransferase